MTPKQSLGLLLLEFSGRRKVPSQAAIINAAATLIHNVVPNEANMRKARAALVEAGCDNGILLQIDELVSAANIQADARVTR